MKKAVIIVLGLIVVISILDFGRIIIRPSGSDEFNITRLMWKVRLAQYTNRQERIVLTPLIQEHISIGTEKEKILKAFRDKNFEVHNIKNPKHFNLDGENWDEGWVIEINTSPWYSLLSGSKFEIYLKFRKEKVGDAKGWIDRTYL